MYVSMKQIKSDHANCWYTCTHSMTQQQNDTMNDDTLWNQTYILGIQGHCDNI